jgi:hypothetical protein
MAEDEEWRLKNDNENITSVWRLASEAVVEYMSRPTAIRPNDASAKEEF